MKALVVWWDLTASAQTVVSLRRFLHDEAVPTWAALDGLLFKTWLADPVGNRWGAVQIWRDGKALDGPLPTRAAELIGYPPTSREVFDVEGVTTGPAGVAGLTAMFAAPVPGS